VLDNLSPALALALVMAPAFAFTNGLLDAALSNATIVATRAATPGRAMALSAVCTFIGPLVFGGAVAATVAAIVNVAPTDEVAVLGAAMTGAATWNLITWRLHLPSSASHALIGGLIGAALLDGGINAVAWGPIKNGHLSGVLGILIGLILGVVLGTALAAAAGIIALRLLQRATRRWGGPVRSGQWFTSGGLAFTIGANDAQKSAGLLGALLIVSGRAVPGGTGIAPVLICALALVAGIVLGGWSTSRTIGRRLFPMRSLDGLTQQGSSATVLLVASFFGAPIAASQTVSSSVVGVGVARQRWRHVSWQIVRRMGVAWLTTIPAAALLAALLLPVWQLIPGG